ncbi:MAG: hypothetical protein PVI09_21115 [Anaerolineae bacterium]|jgi:hypothetical protein
MPKTVYSRIPSSATVHSGAGVLRGYLISHSETTIQTVTFYDNTAASGTVLLIVKVAPEQVPLRHMFGRDDVLSFSTGLSVDVGNCDICVWAVGFD